MVESKNPMSTLDVFEQKHSIDRNSGWIIKYITNNRNLGAYENLGISKQLNLMNNDNWPIPFTPLHNLCDDNSPLT